MEVIPGLNQYKYTITSDGSLNITGKCGDHKDLQFECGNNGVWRKTSTCKDSGGKYCNICNSCAWTQ